MGEWIKKLRTTIEAFFKNFIAQKCHKQFNGNIKQNNSYTAGFPSKDFNYIFRNKSTLKWNFGGKFVNFEANLNFSLSSSSTSRLSRPNVVHFGIKP